MRNFHVFSRVRLFSLVALLAAGCSYNANIRERAEFLQTGAVEQMPVVAPNKSVSSLREGLSCMDRMLFEEQVPTTLIAVKNIPDASGLFSTSTKDMLITALSRMSRTSQAFRVVDYEVDPLRQDTVQNMTNLLLSNGLISLQKPEIYISGSISFGDKTVVSKRRNIGVSTENTDTGWTYDALGSMVGLELHLGDMNTRTLYSGIDSANEVVVATGGRSFELGGKATGLPSKIYRMGVQLEISSDVNQGAGAAVRALADLAAIELVGKWARVPYWQCISYEQNHPEFLRQLREWYDELPRVDRYKTVQQALRSVGYWEQEPDGKLSEAFRQALMHYQRDHDLVSSGMVTFETYEKLLRSYVVTDASGDFKRIGWGRPNSERSEAENVVSAPSPKLGNPPKKLAPVSVQLVGHRGDLSLGDPVVIRVVPARGGYLYCYYQDAGGKVSQIYPNPMQLAPQVAANRSLTIPDVNNPNSFMIDSTKVGSEDVFCAISPEDLQDRIPSKFTKADLNVIKRVSDLAEVKAAFAAASPKGGLSTGSHRWSVKKKE